MKTTRTEPRPAPTEPRATVKLVRCAIYTRKSSEEGLEQEFNSLDAQREAGEAFIRSQAGEGWALLADRYDDDGYTGGNTERPGLQRLLADIERGRSTAWSCTRWPAPPPRRGCPPAPSSRVRVPGRNERRLDTLADRRVGPHRGEDIERHARRPRNRNAVVSRGDTSRGSRGRLKGRPTYHACGISFHRCGQEHTLASRRTRFGRHASDISLFAARRNPDRGSSLPTKSDAEQRTHVSTGHDPGPSIFEGNAQFPRAEKNLCPVARREHVPLLEVEFARHVRCSVAVIGAADFRAFRKKSTCTRAPIHDRNSVQLKLRLFLPETWSAWKHCRPD
jgi:Resolvase, N terminal domain